MTIKMLIDASHEEETRVAIVHGNRVEEFDYESSAKKQIKGNIYLAKITRVEPSLQAAFVEYGGNRHGFLAFSEIHPDYYQIPVSDREALIAEETAAYNALLKEDDDEEIAEQKPKRKPRRKASPKSRKKPAAKPSEDSEAVESKPSDNSEKSNGEKAADEDKKDDKPSVTKAEAAGESDVITEEVNPDDLDTDVSAKEETAADEDDSDINGVDIIDDDEAQEKMRIKIAKGLRRKYKIQEVIKKNQIMLIQVVKEERGNKGAALTTYMSLPGRYCVLMPNTLHGGGVSRKIAQASDRKSLKKILAGLDMPGGIACIIRTAGQGRTKTEIKRDFDYLIRTWEGIRERTLKSVAPLMINEEGDLIKRSIRDLYTKEIDEILVEGEEGYKTARNFMKLIMPSHARKVKHYEENIPLLHRYQVENQLDAMYSPTVQLKSGGYIVINPTEALVSIDVNSGKATRGHNIEDTARKTNLEAAEEVARQLRLRDMAGLIVIDFIDMEVRSNNRAVEQKMKECLKSDRARIQVGRISSFGLMEMSRQRLRAGVLESSTRTCPHCEGSGLIRSTESQVLHILRELEEEGIKGRNKRCTIYLPEQPAIFLLNNKRTILVRLQDQYAFSVEVAIDNSLTESAYRMELPNPEPKKSDKAGGRRQGAAQDNRGQKKTGGNRSSEQRSNRQRNQSRKNRENKPEISENKPETDENTKTQPGTDSQDNKSRRRRRPRRRNSRNETESAPEQKSAVKEDVKAEQTPEQKKEDKPTRRPYPPQARSRQKSGDDKQKPVVSESKAEKSGAKKSAPEKASNEKASNEKASNEKVSTEMSGPKKSGWWQRTFG